MKNNQVAESMSTLVWDKYIEIVPDNIKNRMFTTAKSIFIYNLQKTLLIAFKRNDQRNPDQRNGISVPLSEFNRIFPREGSFSYVHTKLRELGVVVRLRKDMENQSVWLYIECYTKDLERLKSLKNSKKPRNINV